MNMNPNVMESLYAATYVEDYMDACENLPDDVQRQLSRMRELDVTCQGFMRDANLCTTRLLELHDIPEVSEDVQKEVNSITWKLQQLLISAQETGDEKLQIAQQIQDYVDNKVRQLDLDKKNLGIDSCPESSSMDIPASSRDREAKQSQQQNGPPERSSILKRARRARHEVYVPSIFGPSTLAPTRFTSEEQKEKKKSDAGAGSTKSSSTSTPSKENPPGIALTAVVPLAHAPPSKSSLNPKAAKMDVTSSPIKSAKVTGNNAKKEANAHSNGSTVNSSRAGSGSNKIRERDRDQPMDESIPVSTPALPTPKIAPNFEVDLVKVAEVLSLVSTPSSTPKKEKTSSATAAVVTPAAAVTATPTTVATPTVTASSAKHEKESKKKVEIEKKKIKKKTRQTDSPPNIPDVDPDEPTYCLCDQVSYGEMVGCDNDLCPIEWFHFSCVSMTSKPKGKWFCPMCRGDRPTVMKSKAIFLKELEKYNREKEEKN